MIDLFLTTRATDPLLFWSVLVAVLWAMTFAFRLLKRLAVVQGGWRRVFSGWVENDPDEAQTFAYPDSLIPVPGDWYMPKHGKSHHVIGVMVMSATKEFVSYRHLVVPDYADGTLVRAPLHEFLELYEPHAQLLERRSKTGQALMPLQYGFGDTQDIEYRRMHALLWHVIRYYCPGSVVILDHVELVHLFNPRTMCHRSLIETLERTDLRLASLAIQAHEKPEDRAPATV